MQTMGPIVLSACVSAITFTFESFAVHALSDEELTQVSRPGIVTVRPKVTQTSGRKEQLQ